MTRLTDEERDLAGKNRGLAVKMARKVWNRAHRVPELEDLCQAAMVGLCDAAQGFDSNRGVKFSSYACKACYHAAHSEAVTQGVIYRPVWTGRPAKQGSPLMRQVNLARFPVQLTVGLHDHSDPPSHESDDRWEVADMLAKMPAKHRDMVELWMRGDTFAAIARELGLSREWVGSSVHNAIAKAKWRSDRPGRTP